MCQKTVYFAERKEHEGKLYHVTCFNKWWKDKQSTGTGLWGGQYDKSADVQPSYYRTADAPGATPHMESGSDYKARLAYQPCLPRTFVSKSILVAFDYPLLHIFRVFS